MHVKVTVALSTKGEKKSSIKALFQDLSDQTLLPAEILVILQGANIKDMLEIAVETDMLSVTKIISDDGVGLSRSRNKAIQEATGQVILLADDDCRYPEKSLEIVSDAVNKYPNYSFYTFRSVTPGGEVRNKKIGAWKDRKHSRASIMSVCSVEILFSLSDPVRVPACFDERFGLGTKFGTGAENIMLSDLMHNGYRGLFVAQDIVIHDSYGSGQGKGVSMTELAFSKGAMFRRIYGLTLGLFPCIYYFLKCRIKKRIDFSIRDYYASLVGFFQAPR